jgi:Family of unknown function (DUF5652)
MMIYNPLYSVLGITPTIIILFIFIALWEAVWKGIALWKSGKNKQFAWFVCIFVINTLGILPIIYLLFFQKHEGKERRPQRRRIKQQPQPVRKRK